MVAASFLITGTETHGTFKGSGQIVFTFPGQGSYHPCVLQDIFSLFPETHVYFHQADEISQRFLQHRFLPLATAPTQEEHVLQVVVS